MNNTPTALHWWIEESKLLDGDSQTDCCVGKWQDWKEIRKFNFFFFFMKDEI